MRLMCPQEAVLVLGETQEIDPDASGMRYQCRRSTLEAQADWGADSSSCRPAIGMVVSTAPTPAQGATYTMPSTEGCRLEELLFWSPTGFRSR